MADEYEGFDAVTYAELPDDALDHYLAANVAAVRDVVERARPDVALANHLVMGPAILARALGGEVPYAVKVHGSALEYTVRPEPERFLPYAREGLEGAGGVLVGSRHTAESLWEVVDEPWLPERTRLGPPGVDTAAFRPRPPEEAAERLTALADRLEGTTAGWGGEAGASDALRELDPARDPIVSYVGKLIVSKGVDLLLAAWPLVGAEVPDARLVVVGFGTYRDGLLSLKDALARGDLDAAREIAARGRELEGGPAGEMTYLAAFLDGLEGERRERYLAAAGPALARVELHRAARARGPPRSAAGLPGAGGAEHVPRGVRHGGRGGRRVRGVALVRRPLRPRGGDPHARAGARPRAAPAALVRARPGRRGGDRREPHRWLALDPETRERARAALSEEARARYGWEGVARGRGGGGRGPPGRAARAGWLSALGGLIAPAEQVIFRPPCPRCVPGSRDSPRSLSPSS